MARVDAQERCESDVSCLGLHWRSVKGGDGRTASTGWYQGCGGAIGAVSDVSWHTVAKPAVRTSMQPLSRIVVRALIELQCAGPPARASELLLKFRFLLGMSARVYAFQIVDHPSGPVLT